MQLLLFSGVKWRVIYGKELNSCIVVDETRECGQDTCDIKTT